MPKPKPDQIIRHEIVLGRSERELLDGALMAYQFNRVATPSVALLSDISAMTLVFSGLAIYLGFKFEVGSIVGGTMDELLTEFNTQYNAFKESEELAAGVAIGGAVFQAQFPFANLLYNLLGIEIPTGDGKNRQGQQGPPSGGGGNF